MRSSSVDGLAPRLMLVLPATLGLVLSVACGPGGPLEEGAPFEGNDLGGAAAVGAEGEVTQAVNLRLETRDGVSSTGWSFGADKLVPASEANLTLSSFDCGARGRWVSLEGRDVAFCQIPTDDVSGDDVSGDDVSESPDTADAECVPSAWIDIGGSHPASEVGDAFLVLREGVVVAHLELLGRSETVEGWFEEPVEPFIVVLDVQLVDEQPVDEQPVDEQP